MVPYIDMHCDSLWPVTNVMTQGLTKNLRRNKQHIDFERLKAGGCMCQAFAIYTNLDLLKGLGETAWQHGQLLGSTLDREVDSSSDMVRMVTTGTEIEDNFNAGYISVLKTVEEGGVFEGDIGRLEAAYNAGVRMSTITWNYENELGFPNPGGIDDDGFMSCTSCDYIHGLKTTGFEFVRRMEELGMIIDLSHLNDAGIRDVFDTVHPQTPVISSHANARGLVSHSRNLSDENLRKIAEHGGISGIAFAHDFLSGKEGNRFSAIEDMIAHIRYIRKLTGIDYIGIGTDFDGIVSDLEISDCSHMQELAEAMDLSGFTDDEIEKVFYKNALRVYKEVLG